MLPISYDQKKAEVIFPEILTTIMGNFKKGKALYDLSEMEGELAD